MIILQSAARFRALPLTSDKPERSQNLLTHTQLSRFQVGSRWNVTHVQLRTRPSPFSACNIENVKAPVLAWRWPTYDLVLYFILALLKSSGIFMKLKTTNSNLTACINFKFSCLSSAPPPHPPNTPRGRSLCLVVSCPDPMHPQKEERVWYTSSAFWGLLTWHF